MEEIRDIAIKVTVTTNKQTYTIETEDMDEAIDFYYEKVYGISPEILKD